MGEVMTFPDTVEEFMEQYKITDTEQVYTNGTELVPIFRMNQWFENHKDAKDINVPARDCISRQQALKALRKCQTYLYDARDPELKIELSSAEAAINNLPTIQTVATDTNVGDKISKFIDGFEEIFADLRERHVDDSVCGLCEYDGAYMGQSGDWCNECPGFERDDCFKLSDKTRKEWTEEIIKALPTIQPEPKEGHWIEEKIYRDVIECNCSECGQLMTTAASVRMNYCPNCGAKMKGVRQK